jgi:CRP-like cAMP-binding protein
MGRKNVENVTSLPRGGYLIDTPIGAIQFGSPPETIKDTMILESSVPKIFVLPRRLFHWQKGINLSDMEFPIYFNFFIKQQKTLIICTKNQADTMKAVLEESVFGPKTISLTRDTHPSNADSQISDIRNELAFYRGKLELGTLCEFGIFQDDSYSMGEVTITRDKDRDFDVFVENKKIAHIPGTIDYQPKYAIGQRLSEPYKPPLFGVTCLGPSHGFDPTENTSGFLIWLNHNGIMVDPPVDSTEWLKDSNVNPKLIDSIILTHAHADHDAGTFQKILEEGKVTIYSTPTVMDSFLKKYSALSRKPVEQLETLFTFHPIYIDAPVFIHGGEFNFAYRLHSIPTLGFSLKFQNQTFVYSSDHQGDPEVQKKLLTDGIISKERYNELQSFEWDSKVIYHESGIPPLHTPIKYLNSLNSDIQKRTVIYHIAKKDFVQDTDLTLATFGIENTLYFETESPKYEKTYQILGLLKHLDFFDSLPVHKVQEFVSIIESEKFKKGQTIIKKGTKGNKFFIIFSGNAAVRDKHFVSDKVLGEYEYFGEVALLTAQTRTVDIIAATDVEVYTIEKEKFRSFISGTEFENTLHRLIKNRSTETWNILNSNPMFQMMTTYQKTWIESILEPIELQQKGTIAREGEVLRKAYIIQDGTVDVSRKGKKITQMKRGELIGVPQKILQGEEENYTFSFKNSIKLFEINEEYARDFFAKNPGLAMKLHYSF